MGISACFDQSNDIVSNQPGTPVFPCLASPYLSYFLQHPAIMFFSSSIFQEVRIHRECQRWETRIRYRGHQTFMTCGSDFLMGQIQLSRARHRGHSPMLPCCIQSDPINAGIAFSVWEVCVPPKLRGGHDSRSDSLNK